MKASARPPGPRQRLLSGSFPEFRRDTLTFLEHCARDFGDIATFRLAHRRCIFINHPDLIDQVLVKNNRNFIKPFAFRFTKAVLGNGLLTSEGSFWLRQRRLAAPAFKPERINSYGADMVAATLRMMSSWTDGETRDIHADMMHLTLDVVARTLFGTDVTDQSEDIGESLLLALRSFANNFARNVPLPAWVPTRGNRRSRAAVRSLNRIVHQIIDTRRRDPEHRGDLLSMMMHARDEDGSQMSDNQLADEARTFMLAGHETTAIALTWSWFLLAQHPEIQAALGEELDRVLGDRPPQVGDLAQLKLTEQIFLETMRLYPPVFLIGREAVGDCEIGGYPIAGGTTVFMSQWVMHHDARFYSQPEEFRPERWTDENSKKLPKMAYFPFGGGPRVCIGNTFAMMEGTLLLATIAQRYRVELAANQQIRLSPLLTLRPRYGIKVILHPRRET